MRKFSNEALGLTFTQLMATHASRLPQKKEKHQFAPVPLALFLTLSLAAVAISKQLFRTRLPIIESRISEIPSSSLLSAPETVAELTDSQSGTLAEDSTKLPIGSFVQKDGPVSIIFEDAAIRPSDEELIAMVVKTKIPKELLIREESHSDSTYRAFTNADGSTSDDSTARDGRVIWESWNRSGDFSVFRSRHIETGFLQQVSITFDATNTSFGLSFYRNGLIRRRSDYVRSRLYKVEYPENDPDKEK